MPFTGSHPAAILPLLRTPLPASALVIGSMAPDIPYYVPYVSGPTHSALGIVSIDLLLGLAAWLLWHGVLTAPALAAAPAYVRQRLVPQVRTGLSSRIGGLQLGLVLLGLVIGSATHVGWDAFTHAGRFGPAHLAILAERWHGLPGWHSAQYASTVLGGVTLLLWLVRWFRGAPVAPVHTVAGAGAGAGAWDWARRPSWVWPALLMVAALVGGIAAATSPSLRAAAFRGATHGAAAALALGLILAVSWHAARARRSPARRAPDHDRRLHHVR